MPGLAFAAGNAGKVFNCSCTTYTFCHPPPFLQFSPFLAGECGVEFLLIFADFRRSPRMNPPLPLSPHLYISQNFLFLPRHRSDLREEERRKEEECVKNRILLLSWPRISDFSFSLSPSFAQGRRTYLFGEGGGEKEEEEEERKGGYN